MLGSVFVLLMGVVFLAASAVFSRKAQACVPTAKKLIRGDVSQEIWDHHVGAFFDAVRWVRITAAVAWIMLCAGAVVITVIMMVQDSDQWGGGRTVFSVDMGCCWADGDGMSQRCGAMAWQASMGSLGGDHHRAQRALKETLCVVHGYVQRSSQSCDEVPP